MPISTGGMGQGDPTVHERLALVSGGVLLAYVAALVLWPAPVGLSVLGIVLTPPRVLLAASLLLLTPTLLVRLPRPTPLVLGWAAFLVAAGVTVALHPSMRSLARWLSLGVEGAGVFFAVRFVARELHMRRQVVVVLMIASVAVAAASLLLVAGGIQYTDALQRVLGLQVGAGPSRERFGLLRIEGSLGQPLVFATWLVAPFGLLLPSLSARARGMQRWTAWVGWLVIGLAILATVSRSAIVLSLLLPAAYLVVRGKRKASGLAAAAAIPCIVAVVLLTGTISLPPASTSPLPAPTGSASAPAATPTPTQSSQIEESGALRAEAYGAAAVAVGQAPLFGHGLLGAADVLSSVTGRENYVDSTYLEAAVETGLVGLGTLLALLFLVLRAAWSQRATPDGAAGVVALVALVLLCGVSSFFSFTQGWALFWATAGMASVGLSSA